MKFKIITHTIFFALLFLFIPNTVFAKYIVITCKSPKNNLEIKDYYFSDSKFNTLIFINNELHWKYAGSTIQHNFSGNSLSVVVYDNRGYMVGYTIPNIYGQPANQLVGTSIFQPLKSNLPPAEAASPTQIICSMQTIN